jgi:hypothetical protein
MINQFISWLEVLLQYYGADFMTFRKLQALLEAMQLEVGCRGNPFNTSCDTLGQLALDGWAKVVREQGLALWLHGHIGLPNADVTSHQGLRSG